MLKRAFLSALLALTPSLSAFAEDAPKQKPDLEWTVTAECKMIVLPQKDALSLINEFNDDAKTEAAWEQVNKMVESGQAELVGNLISRGSEGSKLTAECIEKIRYGQRFRFPKQRSYTTTSTSCSLREKRWMKCVKRCAVRVRT